MKLTPISIVAMLSILPFSAAGSEFADTITETRHTVICGSGRSIEDAQNSLNSKIRELQNEIQMEKLVVSRPSVSENRVCVTASIKTNF